MILRLVSCFGVSACVIAFGSAFNGLLIMPAFCRLLLALYHVALHFSTSSVLPLLESAVLIK
jgi:hypothetical protein